MKFDNFDYIMAIAQERNLTKAAKKLFISQPALTIYLNKLEENLGIKLFDRSSSPIKITYAGELYIQEFQKIENIKEGLYAKLNLLAQNKEKSISIGIGKYRGKYWLPILIPKFLEIYPDVKINIKECSDDELEKYILNQTIDLAFSSTPIISPDIEYLSLKEEEVLVVLPPKHPALKDKNLKGNSSSNPLLINHCDIINDTFLLPARGHRIYRYILNFMKTFNVNSNKIINIENSDTALQLTSKGIGVTFSISGYELYSNNKDEIPIYCSLGLPLLCRTAVIAFSKNKNLSIHENTLIEIAKTLH